ncbi:DNA primase family protein [Mesorhizobium sp.]|uniref:DNA primase family protein n=2 Tax=unclassified Mesorhizobium TaxID=325217 RepID=UPI0025DD5DEB|nr:DNA primase family protein [Mesorhizobium sp.]
MSSKKSAMPDQVAAVLEEAQRQAAAYGIEPRSPLFGASETRRQLPEQPDEQSVLSDCASEPETDIGNGRRFLIRYGSCVLHVARVGWHGFDGTRWKEDEDGSVVRPLAQSTAELISAEAALLTATEEEEKTLEAGRNARLERKRLGPPRKDWDAEKLGRLMELEEIIDAADEARKSANARKSSRHRHAKSSAGSSKLDNMMKEALPHVARMVGDLNKDIYAFNCRSGTLRFVRMEHEESDPQDPVYEWQARLDLHNPVDLISKSGEAEYRPGAAAPVFDAFLKEVQPDPEIRGFLQRFAGYCLLGLTVEQCLVFFYGAGSNGKSTFVDLLCSIFGDFAVTLSIDSFAGDTRRGGNEATPDLARLPGARLVAASEPEMGVKLKDALIKTLTGGEKIAVRRLHQDFFEVVPQFKILLSGNHKPRIDDTSDGIWRRVYLVPWEVQISKDRIDRDLPKKLRAEADGVFAWLVQGTLDYLNYGLRPPESVLAATREYREESDPIGAFLRNACIVTGKEEDETSPGDLHLGYANWAAREGAAEFKASTFSRKLPDYTRLTWRSPEGAMKRFWKAKSGTTIYRGIRVKDEFVRPPGRDPGPAPEAYGFEG